VHALLRFLLLLLLLLLPLLLFLLLLFLLLLLLLSFFPFSFFCDLTPQTMLRDWKLRASTEEEAVEWVKVLTEASKAPLRIPRNTARELQRKNFNIV
jgi:hypothetical protein